jgi:hypothetical protein
MRQATKGEIWMKARSGEASQMGRYQRRVGGNKITRKKPKQKTERKDHEVKDKTNK